MRKGFTLIELLVVITILAVLAGAALPYVQNYVDESRIAKAKTDIEEIARAIAVYETREGDYTKDTVADLTGRYLNKAPIDPWGRPYVVATISGLVISGGPDRDYDVNDRDAESNADNIQAPYQPPLALVSVKWIDKNQTVAVDDINVPDEVHLSFSRKLDVTGQLPDLMPLTGTEGTAINTLDPTDMDELVRLSCLDYSGGDELDDQFEIASATILPNGKVLVLPVKGEVAAALGYTVVADPFVPGSDTIELNSDPTNFFYDIAGYKSLASQAVKILPQ